MAQGSGDLAADRFGRTGLADQAADDWRPLVHKEDAAGLLPKQNNKQISRQRPAQPQAGQQARGGPHTGNFCTDAVECGIHALPGIDCQQGLLSGRKAVKQAALRRPGQAGFVRRVRETAGQLSADEARAVRPEQAWHLDFGENFFGEI